MSLNSNFDALSNDGLIVEIFPVVPELKGSAPGTNVTKIDQAAAEGELTDQNPVKTI